MASIAVDFAWTKPSVAQLLSWGVTAAGMYVSNDTSKNANASLVKSYAAAGIKTFLFFENTAARALGGYSAGTADAKFAYGLAATYGKPAWAPIIPTADFDVPDYAPNSSDPKLKLGPVGEYFRAWHDYNKSIGVIADAAYGDYYVIKRLTAAGLCDLGVQTLAWSGGLVDLADIVLYQNGQMLDSGQVDVEVIENTALLTHLAWIPGEPNPVAPPPPATINWSMWPSTLTLSFGDTGNAVKVLQTACANSGIYGVRGIAVDGDFGPQTLTAVKNFQSAEGLTIDGIAGPATRSALYALHDV